MAQIGIWEPLAVKIQTIKSALEVCVSVCARVYVSVRVMVCLCRCRCVHVCATDTACAHSLLKTSVLLLRIDDILSGLKKEKPQATEEPQENPEVPSELQE
jgi:hypothetical protein